MVARCRDVLYDRDICSLNGLGGRALGQGLDARVGLEVIPACGDDYVTGVSNIVTVAVGGHTGSDVVSAPIAGGTSVQLGSSGGAPVTPASRTNPKSGFVYVIAVSSGERVGVPNKTLLRSQGVHLVSSEKSTEGVSGDNNSGSNESDDLSELHCVQKRSIWY